MAASTTDGTPPPARHLRRARRWPRRPALPDRLQCHPRRAPRSASRAHSRTASSSRICSTRATSEARWCSGTRAASPCSPRSRPGVPVVEYTPAEIKLAVAGYGRAEKPQIAADGEAPARSRRAAVAARRRRRARGRHLPRARGHERRTSACPARAPSICAAGGTPGCHRRCRRQAP